MDGRSSAHPWSEADILGSLNSGDGCFKLVRGAKILGYCFVRESGGELEVLNLVVDRHVQGRGYGGRLLREVMALPAYAPLSRVWLEVARDNVPARALYNSLGFVDAGMRRNYYRRQGRPTDACIMRKDIRTR